MQLFNGHLALQPHLHLLVPQGVMAGGQWVELPPPTQADVEAVLARMLRQLLPTLESMEVDWPEDGLEALQAQGGSAAFEAR